jgi:hypothetical protein
LQGAFDESTTHIFRPKYKVCLFNGVSDKGSILK